MADKDTKFAGYFGIKFGSNGRMRSFAYKVDEEATVDWATSPSSEKDSEKRKPRDQETEAKDQREDLEILMERFSDTIMSYYSLIEISSQVPLIFTYAFLEHNVVNPIKNNATCLKEGDGWKVFGLNERESAELAKSNLKLRRMKQGTSALPASTLMSLVAAFDSMIADLVLVLLKDKKEKLHIGEKSVPISDILQASSIDDIVNKFVSDQVYELLRGSHDDQVGFIEKTFDIKIRKYWGAWSSFIEIFERRNLLAHGESHFTQRYRNICDRHGKSEFICSVGDQIDLNEEYLLHSADTLLEFLLLVTFSLWRKHFDEQEELAFSALNNSAFKLIVEGRSNTANSLLEFGLSLTNVRCSEIVRRMMIINRANALKKMGETEESLKVLDSVEWGAAADNFRICEAAVRDDVDAVVAKMDVVSRSGAMIADDFRDWPVFDAIRENIKFQSEFEKVFSEPLLAPAQRSDVDTETDSDDSGADGETKNEPEAQPKSDAIH